MHPARRLVLAAGLAGAALLAAFQPYRVQVTRTERTPGGATLVGADCARRATAPAARAALTAGRAPREGVDVRAERAERDGPRAVASASWLLLLTALAALSVGPRWRASALRQAVAAVALAGVAFVALDLTFAPLAHDLDGFAAFSCADLLRP